MPGLEAFGMTRDPGENAFQKFMMGQNQQQAYQQQSLNTQGQYANQQAKIGAGATLGAANAAANANKYGAGLQYQLGQNQLAQSQGRFNQLFPYFQGLAGQAGLGGGGGGGGYGVSAGATPSGSVGGFGMPPPVAAPNIGGGPDPGKLGPAISQGQLNSNINLANAQNWSQAGGQARRQQQQLAGGGLGANSPLAKALQAQVFGGALQANASSATQARQQAAELNAQQALGGYQSRNAALASQYGSQVGAQAAEYGSRAAQQASQYGSQLDFQAALAQVQAQRQNAILSALANFAG